MPHYIHITYEGENREKLSYADRERIALEGLDTHPEDAEYIHAWVVNFILADNRYQNAIDYSKKILPMLTIWDCRESVLRMMCRSYEALNRFEEAMEIRKQMLEEDEQKSHHLEEIAEAYNKMGDIENSIKYYLLYIEECNNNCDTQTYQPLAELCEKKGDYAEAAKYWLGAARHECYNTSWVWYNTGRALALAGKEEEAAFYFKIALAINEQSADTHYLLGNIYQNKGDSYRALHHYMEALKIEPNYSAVYNNLGVISFDEDGDIKGAIENIEKALTMNPDKTLETRMYINLSRLYKQIFNYEKHNYYKGKVMEAAGFPPGFIVEDDDDE